MYIGLLTHDEAKQNEVSQLAASGCGVTALLNVLIALKVLPVDHVGSLDWSSCILRARDNDAPLGQYLLSRSVAGCTGEDLVTSMETLVGHNQHLLSIPGRTIDAYFMSHADIIASGVTMRQFVAVHVSRGCCLVATLNLQIIGNDAWHHQMIYGIDLIVLEAGNTDTAVNNSELVQQTIWAHDKESSIHCVNPVEAYPEHFFEQALSTPSVLLVRCEDIISRFERPGSDDSVYDRAEWRRYQVRQQVQAVVDAHHHSSTENVYAGPSHVLIPAKYVGGFAIFQLRSE